MCRRYLYRASRGWFDFAWGEGFDWFKAQKPTPAISLNASIPVPSQEGRKFLSSHGGDRLQSDCQRQSSDESEVGPYVTIQKLFIQI